MKILCFILNFRFKWTTIQHFASCAEWRLFKLGFYCTAQAVLTMVRPVQRSQIWGGFRSQRRMKSFCQLVYTSTPLIRDPSKTMVKSWIVCRIRIRELTVMWSRRSALSSYIRVMAGHSASNGIHCGSRWSLVPRQTRIWNLPSFPMLLGAVFIAFT